MKIYFAILLLGIFVSSEANIIGRIVGGWNAEVNQFPWQIALYFRGSFNCGGSIIAKNWVLTAAHCVEGGKASDFQILAGTIKQDKSTGSLHSVVKVIAHEKYGDFMNDIALIQISGEFKLDSSRQIIALGTHNIPDGDIITVSGWGRISTGGSLPSNLKFNKLSKVDAKSCASAVGFTYGLICLGHPVNQGVCNGDSGGPAVHNNKLVGVANFVIGGCGSRYPDGYASIATFAPWIRGHVGLISVEFM